MHTQDESAATRRTATGRAEMALVGGFAGLTIWALFEHVPDVVAHPQAYLALVSFVSSFFAVLLGLSGPYRVARAALPALWLSALAAGLLTWSSWRFAELDGFHDAAHPYVAWGVLIAIGTPFAAALLRDHHSLRDYGHLFDVSWSILVRYSAGWLFSGLFWAVLFMSNALFEIVGLTVIEDLIDIDGAPFVITGLSLGLGLSVVHEMRDYLSPYLVLRLLRLLVPVLLLVVVVFVLAALGQDPGALFGNLSRTATLLTVGFAMVCLVSISLDRGDLDAVQGRWMRVATALLALLLPVIAGLAIYALWLRVAQYGWTPDRLAVACAATILGLYALAYAAAVALRANWMARIRLANIVVAVLILLTAAAWLSPLLNAERLSTRSQMARIESGTVPLEDMALFEMAQLWGKPGQAGIAALKDGAAQADTALAAKLELAQSSRSRWSYEQDVKEAGPKRWAADVHAHLTVLPEGAGITAKMLESLPEYRLRDWARTCKTKADPGCVLLLDSFQDTAETRQGILFVPAAGPKYTAFSVFEGEGVLLYGEAVRPTGDKQVTVTQVRTILEGRYEVAPSSRRSLWIGEMELSPDF